MIMYHLNHIYPTNMKNRTPEQQEYRDNLAQKIKNIRRYYKGGELAWTLLDDEKLKYEYIKSLGEGRKLDKETSRKRLDKDAEFVVKNLENFDLDNNKIAERLIEDYPIFFLYNLKHFKWLNSLIAEKITYMWCFADKFLCKNMDSFDESTKLIIMWELNNDFYWMENEIGNDKIKEVKVKDNINVDYRQWNKSKEVDDYFSKNKFEKPFFEIVFDGKKMLLTRLQPIFNWSYYWFVWFIEVNWRYEIRYFIKSWSEQLRRCCPWYCSDSHVISKLDEFNPLGLRKEIAQKYINAWFNFTWNFSYERSTMVDLRLWQELERIYIESVNKKWKYHEYFDPERKWIMRYPNGGANTMGNSAEFDEGIANRCIRMSEEIDIIDDFLDRFQFNIGKLTIEKFKEIYETENIWIDINSVQLESKKRYRYYHKGFGCCVYVDVCSAKMLGKNVEIFFSYTEKEPDLIWIDNIQYKNQPMNSYWIPAKQINAWWLTKKPVDYFCQCPNPDKDFPSIGFQYKDIRSLYQWHPLIKKYKELCNKK